MPDPKFKRGHPKKGGRKKGTPNKVSKNIKENFEAVFEKLGGVKGFCEWAKSNKQTKERFYQMYSKMLPSNVDAELSGDIGITIKKILTDERPGE